MSPKHGLTSPWAQQATLGQDEYEGKDAENKRIANAA
jgi:hypothetical protein